MTFERQIFGAVSLVFALSIPASVVGYWGILKVIKDENRLLEKAVQQSILVDSFRYSEARKAALASRYVIDRDRSLHGRFDDRHRDSMLLIGQLEALDLDATTRQLVEIAADGARASSDAERSIYSLDEAKASTATRLDHYAKQSVPTCERTTRAAKNLDRRAKSNLDAARAQFTGAVTQTLVFTVVISVVALATMTLLCIHVMRKFRKKFALDQRERSISRARKEVVEVVAHDLKAPLASVAMSLDLIGEELSTPRSASVDLHLGILNRSVGSMQKLISDLLDHANIESGQLALVREPGDLVDLLEDLKHRFASLAAAKAVTLEIKTRPTPGQRLTFDHGRMDQAVSNLISNAIKHTPAGGWAALSLRCTERFCKISVSNSGSEIPIEDRAHIFDRYWRGRTAASHNAGLGLAIVKSVAEAHGGDVRLVSNRAGTCFTIRIPR